MNHGVDEITPSRYHVANRERRLPPRERTTPREEESEKTRSVLVVTQQIVLDKVARWNGLYPTENPQGGMKIQKEI